MKNSKFDWKEFKAYSESLDFKDLLKAKQRIEIVLHNNELKLRQRYIEEEIYTLINHNIISRDIYETLITACIYSYGFTNLPEFKKDEHGCEYLPDFNV